MPSGGTVANLRLATTESWRDKQTGENKEATEWHTVVVFGRTAEVAQQYLRKGSQVFIEGRLRTRKWQDKSTGADRYSTEIVANDMQMLGGRGEGGGGGGGGGRGMAAPSGGDSDWGGESRGAPAASSGGGDQGFQDDDIPF